MATDNARRRTRWVPIGGKGSLGEKRIKDSDGTLLVERIVSVPALG